MLTDANGDPLSAGYYAIELDGPPYDLQDDLPLADNPSYHAPIEAGTPDRLWYQRRAAARRRRACSLAPWCSPRRTTRRPSRSWPPAPLTPRARETLYAGVRPRGWARAKSCT